MKKVKLFLLIFGISAICFAETPTKLRTGQNKFNTVLSDNHGDSISQQKNRTPFVLKISPFHIIQGDFITKSFSAGLSFEKPMKNDIVCILGLDIFSQIKQMISLTKDLQSYSLNELTVLP